MKNILSVIVSFFMIIACIPSIAFAANAEDIESLYEYKINNGEVTITKYIGNEKNVEIPSEIEGLPVTYIGEKAFCECQILESVNIPGSVKSIGDYAFDTCNLLKRVIISDGVQSIGKSAFAFCIKLEQVTLPNSIEVISNATFASCRALKGINIPEKIKDIRDSAFLSCEVLKV